MMRDYSHISRWRKLLHIGQSHLAPGMTLYKLQSIFEKYSIGDSWGDVSDQVVDEVFGEIADIVKFAKNGRGGDCE